MTLIEFTRNMEKGELEVFAARCKTTVGHLKQVRHGHRRASASLAINLDRETNGLVSCEETRPDIDWAYLRNSHSSAA